MKRIETFILLLVWLVSVSVLMAAGSKDPLNVKRLRSKHQSFTTYDTTYSTSTITSNEWDYFYQGEFSELIGFVNGRSHQEYWYGSEGEYNVIYDNNFSIDYAGSSTPLGENILYIYDAPAGVTYQYVRDQQRNLTNELRQTQQGDFTDIERFHGQGGRLDRLLFENHSSMIFYDYFLNYTDSQIYPSSLNGYRNVTLNYGATPTPHPVALHPAELFLVDTDFDYYELLLYMTIINPTYQLQSYTDNDTGLEYHLTWSQDASGYGFLITENLSGMRFDTDGYPTRYHFLQEVGFSLFITWDTIVLNDDNPAPAAENSLRAYPNPFGRELTICLDNKADSPRDIGVYNVKGQLVRQWKDTIADKLLWDGKDAAGRMSADGIYLIKARQGNGTVTAKVMKGTYN